MKNQSNKGFAPDVLQGPFTTKTQRRELAVWLLRIVAMLAAVAVLGFIAGVKS